MYTIAIVSEIITSVNNQAKLLLPRWLQDPDRNKGVEIDLYTLVYCSVLRFFKSYIFTYFDIHLCFTHVLRYFMSLSFLLEES